MKLNFTGAHSVLISKKYIHMLFNYIQKKGIYMPIDHYINAMNPWIWYGDLSENGMFRGLYKHQCRLFKFPYAPGPITPVIVNIFYCRYNGKKD